MSDARIRHLIHEETDGEVSSLENQLSEIRQELDKIKAYLVEKEKTSKVGKTGP